MISSWISQFAHDDKVHVLLILVALDFILGVTVAFVKGTFRMSFLADFLRNDILQKLVPYFALYAMALVAGSVDIVIPGFDFGFVAGTAFAVFTAALVGSILNSLRTLGVGKLMPNEIAGGENAAPPKS